MGRFFNELEDWLSAFARFNDSSPSSNAIGQSALASGMSEEAARAVLSHSRNRFQMARITVPACLIRYRNYPARWRKLNEGNGLMTGAFVITWHS